MGMDQRGHMDYWGQIVRQDAANCASGRIPWQNAYPNKILTPEEASCLPPEPSPADRALDEFVARRVAKRDKPAPTYVGSKKWMDDRRKETRDKLNSDAIDRAMSQLCPHDTDIHTRLMPYRG